MKTHPHLELVRKYARAAKRAALSPDEKAVMKERLMKHIKASSVAISSDVIPAAAPRVASPYAKYFKSTGKVIAPLMLLIVIGGGTSYAAESSLPGDLLYPVKIHINENVVSDLSFSALSQAEWAVQKVKRRLAEAKAIGLQSAAKVGLDAVVAAQTDDADAKIAALDASDPTDAAALTQQLTGLVQDDGIIDASTSPIATNLSTSTDTTSTQVSNKTHKAVPVSVPPATVSFTASATVDISGNSRVNVNPPAVPAVSAPAATVPSVSMPSVSVPSAGAAVTGVLKGI